MTFVRPEVLTTPPVHHGALDYGELRHLDLHPDDVLDFSANVNPYGPPPGVRAALEAVNLAHYPDREALALREALAAHHGVLPAHLVVGNGVAELIWLVALAFVRAGDRVLILTPTYGDYARAVRLMGGQVISCEASPRKGFTPPLEAAERLLAEAQPRLCFICTPNNPTGQVVPADLIQTWAARCAHTLFVVDEAYINFVPGLPSAIAPTRPNLLVLRSMTKDYALAGVRLGYAVGHADLVDGLARVRPSWNVSALAQAAGLAALAGQEHLKRTVRQLGEAKRDLTRELEALGFPVVPSATHFFLVKVGHAPRFRAALIKQGILVRDCTSFGLPAFVRVAARRAEENERLVVAFKRVRELTGMAGRCSPTSGYPLASNKKFQNGLFWKDVL